MANDRVETARAKILPFYLTVDVSPSMREDGKIEAANNIVPLVADELAKNIIISNVVRFGLLDFASDARVVIPLGNLLDLEQIPNLEIRDDTSYGSAFTKLREVIEADFQQLNRDSYMVHRPAVFFVSDGEPMDAKESWQRAFAALTEYDKETKQGFRFYPNLIPFLVGQESVRPEAQEVVRDIVHPKDIMRPFIAREGADPAEAIARMASVLVQSIIQSGQSVVEEDEDPFVLPDVDDDDPTWVL